MSKRIAFVRPPAIDAHREIFAMHIPMATGALLIESRKVAWFVDGAAEFVGEDYRVQRNAEIVFMELRDDSFRIGKHTRVPGERSIFSIPSRRAKSRAQIDHGVAREFFLTECSGLF